MGVRNYIDLNTLSGGSLAVRKFSNTLRRRAIPKDIYANITGERIIYKRQEMSMPSAVIERLSPEEIGGATSVRVGLKMEVNANIIRGNGVAMGTEVVPVVKSGDLFRNNYRVVFQDKPGYGEHKLDAEFYNLYDTHAKDLAPHGAAEEGLEIRMALVETYGWNLQFGSTANNCAAQWNRHCYVGGIPTIWQQPQFHPNWAIYTNRIVGAMDTASGGTGTFPQTAGQMLSGKMLDDLVRFAFMRRLWPLSIENNQAFILTLSQLQAARFSSTNTAFIDNLGNRYTRVDDIKDSKVQNWYGMIGKWESAAGATIYFVRDDRLATLLPSGTAAPYGLNAGYMWPTANDQRNLDNPLVRDVSILHGAGALYLLEPEKMHMISQDWDYNVRNGVGYAGNRGFQHMQFDTTPVDPTGAAREYFGSVLVVLGRDENVQYQ
ncbi:MAG: hypothetical protein ACWGNI_00135 [Desulfobacterales bacterium]